MILVDFDVSQLAYNYSPEKMSSFDVEVATVIVMN
jgi:hypothetical protein